MKNKIFFEFFNFMIIPKNLMRDGRVPMYSWIVRFLRSKVLLVLWSVSKTESLAGVTVPIQKLRKYSMKGLNSVPSVTSFESTKIVPADFSRSLVKRSKVCSMNFAGRRGKFLTSWMYCLPFSVFFKCGSICSDFNFFEIFCKKIEN